MGDENKGTISFEATVTDIRFHNSKLDDNKWTDVIVRAAGEHGVTAAMALHRAKNKIIRISFQLENQND